MKIKALANSLTAFRWNSVFIKYLISIFVALVIVFSTITFVITASINAKAQSEKEKSVSLASSKLSSILENTYNYMSINMSNLLEDSDFIPFYTQSDIMNNNFITATHALKTEINDFKVTQASISSIYLYSLSSGYVISTDSSYTNAGAFDTFMFKNVFTDYISHEKAYSISYINDISSELNIVYPLILNNRVVAYISYNLDLNYLASISMFDMSVVDLDENCIVYNTSGKTVFSPDDYYDEKIALFNISNLNIVFEKEKSTSQIPTHYYIGFLIVIIVFSIVLAYVISNLLYYNINTIYLLLFNSLNTGLSKDSSIAEEEYLKQNEYSYILNNVKNLIKKNDTITGALNENLIKLNNTKIHALSLQMSPHFLFNTLNLISTLALESTEESKNKIPKVVDLLSQVLSISLNTSNSICTLRDEILYTKIYIDIQKYKYEDFNVIWTIPDELYKLGITKFTLQPIIENAIHHGFSLSKERSISINCYKSQADYIIKITNSGTLLPEKVTEINEKMNKSETPKKSIGLWNTNQRIKLLFGDEYGCKFFSKDNSTGVIINLPQTEPNDSTFFIN